MPFARQRLWLGITGVGLTVVAAALWTFVVVLGVIPIAPDWRPVPSLPAFLPLDAALAVLLVFAGHALVFAPVEFMGGARVVRSRPSVGAWLAGWLRGIAMYATLFAAIAAVMASAALGLRSVGAAALAPTLVTLGAVLVLFEGQGLVARAFAPMTVRAASRAEAEVFTASGVRADRVRIVEVADESFVGGWVGLLRPRLWIPARWTTDEHQHLLTVQLARRHAQFASGARRRGVIRTVMWQVLGVLVLVPLLPWALTEARTYLLVPAVTSLWAFVGVLVLPTPSRTAVYNADRAAAERVGLDRVLRALATLDRWQDDEPERPRGVEFIFHPVPSLANREAALRGAAREVYGGAHQLTRLTAFTGVATLSLLGRVVHCNVGRPALWAVYPGD